MNQPVREVVAILCAIITFALALVVVGQLAFVLLGFSKGTSYAALVTAVVLSATLVAWWFTRRRLHLPSLSHRAVLVIVAAYGITWALGAPRVHTDLAAAEIAQYKKLKAKGDGRVWDSHPYIQFFVTIPIAPAILLTYHEYQIAGLWGGGEWVLDAWYVMGTRRLIGMGTWIS